MELNYIKNDNEKLFANFKDKNLLEIEDAQNYIPIYQTFFNLNEKNYNNINLNNFYKLQTLEKKISYNKFSGKVLNSATNEIKTSEVFFKFCPLLDPIRYITNKYDLSKNLLRLPKFNDDNNLHVKNVKKLSTYAILVVSSTFA